MYRYDEFDRDFVQPARYAVPRPGRTAAFRRTHRGAIQAASAYERSLSPASRLHAADCHSLRHPQFARQMRMLAHIGRTYDRGYGHFTTRQNLQFNWPALGDVPDILDDLASVEMHAIQTSGNCIRNVTADHFAGAARKTRLPTRGPYAEILRQWSSLHPEFIFLPRKFKIAVSGAEHDRAATQVHDIGLHLKRDVRKAISASRYLSGVGLAEHHLSATGFATFCRKRIFCPTAKRSCGSTTSLVGVTTNTRHVSRFSSTKPARRN